MSDEGMSNAELAYHRARAYQRPGSTDTEMTIEKESMRALIARLDAAEREREAFAERVFRHGFSDGWTANQKGRLAASASVDEAWHFYVADGALQKSVALTANHSAPVVEE